MEIKKFTEYYSKPIRTIMIILIALAVGINIVDIYNYGDQEQYILLINIPTIILVVGVIVLHFALNVKLPVCFGAGIYIIVINILVSDYLAVRPPEEVLLALFRETVFFILMMVFAGIFVQKYNALIVLGVIVYKYIETALLLKHSFLLEHLPIFLVTFFAIAAIVFFFSGILHKSIIEIQRKQKTIIDTNEELVASTEELRSTTDDLIIKNETLQDLNISKDKIFTIISHDLKNPINTVSGFIDLMITKGNNLKEEKRKLYMSHIQTAVKNMVQLLDSVLEWSRTQRNKVEIDPLEVKIDDVTRSVFEFLQKQAEEKDVELVNRTMPEHIVFADYNMVFTVLRNLLSNAVKFSYPGKKAIVVSERVDDEVIVRVFDEGVGISNEIQQLLRKGSEPVFSPGTKGESGSGLGILLCHDYLQKNNGSLNFDSTEGRGSCFWFTLPVKDLKSM